MLALGGSASYSFLVRFPEPTIHDEFSYLLAADTFLEGRLSNPPHPMWRHFETFHVLQHPTYASKYPPGQGLLLALGQVIYRNPMSGVWLSSALASAAIFWMLRAWFPVRWAFLGSLLFILKLGIHSYWAQSYWGGMPAAAGGALLFGAVRRIVEKPSLRLTILMCLGLSLLALTRPWEGFLVSIFAALPLAIYLLRGNQMERAALIKKVILPSVFILSVLLAWIGFYNKTVTGNMFVAPYQLERDTQGVGAYFLWQSPKGVPEYRHEITRRFYVDWALNRYHKQKQDYLREVVFKRAKRFFHLFLGPSLLLALLCFPLTPFNPWFVLNILGLSALAIFLTQTTSFNPHYFAPAICLLYAVIVQGLRSLSHLRVFSRRVGTFFVGMIVISCFVSLALRVFQEKSDLRRGWNYERAGILRKIESFEGKHLVMVRYAPDHDVLQEWVYNAADIDDAKIVWAREMSPEENQKLFEYFKDRKIWLYEPDNKTRSLVPYRSS